MHNAECTAVARCPSVCHTPVSIETAKHIIKLFWPSGSHTIWVFRPGRYGNILRETTLARASNAGGMKKSRISANISSYLRNDTDKIIHTKAFKWYNFQWPWVTSNPDFKVMPLFNTKYLRNGIVRLVTLALGAGYRPKYSYLLT